MVKGKIDGVENVTLKVVTWPLHFISQYVAVTVLLFWLPCCLVDQSQSCMLVVVFVGC